MCESVCASSQWDQGIDDFTPPCNADRWVLSFEYEDDHYDHYDDHYDHYDDHYDDHDDTHDDDHHDEYSPWEWIFPDEVYIDSIISILTL